MILLLFRIRVDGKKQEIDYLKMLDKIIYYMRFFKSVFVNFKKY